MQSGGGVQGAEAGERLASSGPCVCVTCLRGGRRPRHVQVSPSPWGLFAIAGPFLRTRDGSGLLRAVSLGVALPAASSSKL